MGISKVFSKIVTYGLVFGLGYYIAGGCEDYNLSRPSTDSNIELQLRRFQNRLESLEGKIEKLGVENEIR